MGVKLSKSFKMLIRIYTRQEFCNKFEIKDVSRDNINHFALFDKKENRIISECPYHHEPCEDNKDCKECWDNAILNAVFNTED